MQLYLPAIINIAAFFVGQVLVTRRHWGGFLIWAASNCSIAAISVVQGSHPTALMFLVYFTANVYSTILWARQSSKGRSKTPRSLASIFRSIPSWWNRTHPRA
jgi:nicotinamide riboside transporter PnuC